jgi:hypothetical protein
VSVRLSFRNIPSNLFLVQIRPATIGRQTKNSECVPDAKPLLLFFKGIAKRKSGRRSNKSTWRIVT